MTSMVFRLLYNLGSLIIVCLLAYMVVVVINRGIQWLSKSLGYEVKDFFAWLRELLPKRKAKKRKSKTL